MPEATKARGWVRSSPRGSTSRPIKERVKKRRGKTESHLELAIDRALHEAKHVPHRELYNAIELIGPCHREGLATGGLAVAEEGSVVTLHHGVDDPFPDPVVDVLGRVFHAEHVICRAVVRLSQQSRLPAAILPWEQLWRNE